MQIGCTVRFLVCIVKQLNVNKMRITEQPITGDNVFEQMALMTKKKLVEQGVLPSDADKIAIEFVKERGEQVIKNVVKNDK